MLDFDVRTAPKSTSLWLSFKPAGCDLPVLLTCLVLHPLGAAYLVRMLVTTPCAPNCQELVDCCQSVHACMQNQGRLVVVSVRMRINV